MIFKNVIFRNLGLSPKEKRKLKEKIIGKESLLKYLSKQSNKNTIWKKKLTQTGGFLSTILAIAAPILVDLVMRAVS